MNRRNFIKTAAATGILSSAALGCGKTKIVQADFSELDKVMNQPVLKKSLFHNLVIIESVKLLKNRETFIVEVISKDGAKGCAISNNMHMKYLYPILTGKVAPFFVGKDARELESLVDGVYVTHSNYKYQGLAFWVCVASVEFAILDLLGRVAGKSCGELLGGVHHQKIAVYCANNYRGKTASESVERIVNNVTKTGAKAAKIKIGGRMSKNKDYPPGRTEKLIPLVRKKLGDDMVLYADSNGSYDVPNSVRVGKILQDYNYRFFEEPCPFDHYDETKAIADALEIDIAGGEVESSLWAFRWLIGHDAHQVVQPDIFYFGGMIRTMRIAHMAATKNIPCTPHISGSGLGYLYMMQFVSAVANAGPYHEFKGFNKNIPFQCDTSDFKIIDGKIKVPTGPGMGIELNPQFIKKAREV